MDLLQIDIVYRLIKLDEGMTVYLIVSQTNKCLIIPSRSSVLPIVRTCRTAFVCSSDYDDRTQFYMFEQKNKHGQNFNSKK